MPCDTRQNLTQVERNAMAEALKRLNTALELGSVKVVIGRQGAVAFAGWAPDARAGLSDLCAYRRLAASNSPALRKALGRAEAMAGRQLDSRMLTAGIHSHDHGQTWHPGH